MSRTVRLATCQPPAPRPGVGQGQITARALELCEAAGREGADIVCLPECLNVVALGAEETRSAAREWEAFVSEFGALCAVQRMYAVLPIIRREDHLNRNGALLIGRDGAVIGCYDKVHATRTEREGLGIVRGDTYPVFDLDFGRVGMMICYDGCFPEPARILALQGAEVIFFPSLQRSFTETHLELQVRGRAYDNSVYIVRSSYGTEPGQPWKPGVMVGKSCVVGPDGTILADLGRFTGVVVREVDLDAPECGEVTHGGEVGVLRDMRFADRRPETYGALVDEGRE